MPSLAVQPPAVTMTVLKVPAATSEAAFRMAWAGPAQKPRTSQPVAASSPAISAAALAKLPPPRWFMSPHASSQQSMTYSMSVFSRPAFLTAYSMARTEEALDTMFSSMTWLDRLTSMSWAFLTQPTSLFMWYSGSACSSFTCFSISSIETPSLKRPSTDGATTSFFKMASLCAATKSLDSLTRSKTSHACIRSRNSSCGMISPKGPTRLALGSFLSHQGCSMAASSSGVTLPM